MQLLAHRRRALDDADCRRDLRRAAANRRTLRANEPADSHKRESQRPTHRANSADGQRLRIQRMRGAILASKPWQLESRHLRQQIPDINHVLFVIDQHPAGQRTGQRSLDAGNRLQLPYHVSPELMVAVKAANRDPHTPSVPPALAQRVRQRRGTWPSTRVRARRGGLRTRNARCPQPLHHGLAIGETHVEAHQNVARRRTGAHGRHAPEPTQLALQPIGVDAAPPQQMHAQPAPRLMHHPELRS